MMETDDQFTRLHDKILALESWKIATESARAVTEKYRDSYEAIGLNRLARLEEHVENLLNLETQRQAITKSAKASAAVTATRVSLIVGLGATLLATAFGEILRHVWK